MSDERISVGLKVISQQFSRQSDERSTVGFPRDQNEKLKEALELTKISIW